MIEVSNIDYILNNFLTDEVNIIFKDYNHKKISNSAFMRLLQNKLIFLDLSSRSQGNSVYMVCQNVDKNLFSRLLTGRE